MFVKCKRSRIILVCWYCKFVNVFLINSQFPTSNPAPPPFGTYGTLGLPPTLMSPNQVSADQYSVTKPRMRICFDPETEIPKLQKWFAENNHPTRQQVKKDIYNENINLRTFSFSLSLKLSLGAVFTSVFFLDIFAKAQNI